jgi:hypothetical protein
MPIGISIGAFCKLSSIPSLQDLQQETNCETPFGKEILPLSTKKE